MSSYAWHSSRNLAAYNIYFIWWKILSSFLKLRKNLVNQILPVSKIYSRYLHFMSFDKVYIIKKVPSEKIPILFNKNKIAGLEPTKDSTESWHFCKIPLNSFLNRKHWKVKLKESQLQNILPAKLRLEFRRFKISDFASLA